MMTAPDASELPTRSRPVSRVFTPPFGEDADSAVDTCRIRRPQSARCTAVVRETKAAWLPTLYGNGSYTHLDGNRVNAGTVVESQNELGANLTLTVPLVMTRQWMNTDESRLDADATAATSTDVRRTVAYATGQAYLAVYAQKTIIEIDEVARGTARRHADYAHERYAGGVGTSLDEVRALQEVAIDDALVQQAYAPLAAVEEALGIVVGAQGPLDTSEDPVLAAPPTLEDGVHDAERRTDVIALGARLKAARSRSRSTFARALPWAAAGMYARITFHMTGHTELLVVPATSVLIDAEGTRAAVVRDGAISWHKVQIEKDLGDKVAISSGLAEGDVLVAAPSDRLVDGMRIHAQDSRSTRAPLPESTPKAR